MLRCLLVDVSLICWFLVYCLSSAPWLFVEFGRRLIDAWLISHWFVVTFSLAVRWPSQGFRWLFVYCSVMTCRWCFCGLFGVSVDCSLIVPWFVADRLYFPLARNWVICFISVFLIRRLAFVYFSSMCRISDGVPLVCCWGFLELHYCVVDVSVICCWSVVCYLSICCRTVVCVSFVFRLLLLMALCMIIWCVVYDCVALLLMLLLIMCLCSLHCLLIFYCCFVRLLFVDLCVVVALLLVVSL